jgi:hypothetical protein
MPNLSLPRVRSNRPSTDSLISHRRPSKPLVRIRASDPTANPATALDGARWRGIPIADTYHYFDTLKFLSKRPIPEGAIAMLRAHCKHVDIRPHGSWAHPQSGESYQINIYPWRFRIEVHVPDQVALEYFAKRRGLKLTRADLARDFTFNDEHPKNRMLEIFEEHFIQPHQRVAARISFDNGGMSTGRRYKGRYFSAYISRECRVDGVVDCFHGEYRHLGTQALAQIGIHQPKDLLDFNHAEYWSRIDRQLSAIDRERLGRYHSNRHNQQHSRASDQTPFYGRRSHDQWLGSLLYRIHAIDEYGRRSVQSFIRNYGRGPFLIPLGSDRMNDYRRVDTERRQDKDKAT